MGSTRVTHSFLLMAHSLHRTVALLLGSLEALHQHARYTLCCKCCQAMPHHEQEQSIADLEAQQFTAHAPLNLCVQPGIRLE